MTTKLGLGLIAIIAIGTLGCGSVDKPDAQGTHACTPLIPNDDWGSVGTLRITHYLPQECPVDEDATVNAGGTVTELGTTFPDGGDATSLVISACESSSVGSFACGETPLDSDTQYFTHELVGNDWRWQAQSWVYYTAGLNPDYLLFEVYGFFGLDYPKARLTISVVGPEE